MSRGPMDLTGCQFGRLTPIALAGHVQQGDARHVLWRCRCECGEVCFVTTNNLRNEAVMSCGCLKREVTIQRNYKHGHAKRGQWSREYRAYQAMLDRCYDPSVETFKYYGAIGITVCDQWRGSFLTFYGDMGDCPKGRSLDRIDPLGHYTPENCRWATVHQQANNKRTSRFVTVNGERMTVSEAARRFKIHHWTLTRRLNAGIPIESLITNHTD